MVMRVMRVMIEVMVIMIVVMIEMMMVIMMMMRPTITYLPRVVSMLMRDSSTTGPSA